MNAPYDELTFSNLVLPRGDILIYQEILTSSASWRIMGRLSNLGTILNLYGRGVRPDSPSYSSREIGSSGSAWKVYAHNRREIASHNSRSAAGSPGQILRLIWDKFYQHD